MISVVLTLCVAHNWNIEDIQYDPSLYQLWSASGAEYDRMVEVRCERPRTVCTDIRGISLSVDADESGSRRLAPLLLRRPLFEFDSKNSTDVGVSRVGDVVVAAAGKPLPRSCRRRCSRAFLLHHISEAIESRQVTGGRNDVELTTNISSGRHTWVRVQLRLRRGLLSYATEQRLPQLLSGEMKISNVLSETIGGVHKCPWAVNATSRARSVSAARARVDALVLDAAGLNAASIAVLCELARCSWRRGGLAYMQAWDDLATALLHARRYCEARVAAAHALEPAPHVARSHGIKCFDEHVRVAMPDSVTLARRREHLHLAGFECYRQTHLDNRQQQQWQSQERQPQQEQELQSGLSARGEKALGGASRERQWDAWPIRACDVGTGRTDNLVSSRPTNYSSLVVLDSFIDTVRSVATFILVSKVSATSAFAPRCDSLWHSIRVSGSSPQVQATVDVPPPAPLHRLLESLPKQPTNTSCAFAIGKLWVMTPVTSVVPDADPGRLRPRFEVVSCALPNKRLLVKHMPQLVNQGSFAQPPLTATLAVPSCRAGVNGTSSATQCSEDMAPINWRWLPQQTPCVTQSPRYSARGLTVCLSPLFGVTPNDGLFWRTIEYYRNWSTDIVPPPSVRNAYRLAFERQRREPPLEHNAGKANVNFVVYDMGVAGKPQTALEIREGQQTQRRLHGAWAAQDITVVPWAARDPDIPNGHLPIPKILGVDTADDQYHLQTLAINHCVSKYGTATGTAFTAVIDVDELLVPVTVAASIPRLSLPELLHWYGDTFPQAAEFWMAERVHFPPYDGAGTCASKCLRRRCLDRFTCTKAIVRTGGTGFAPRVRTVGVHLALDFTSELATRVPLGVKLRSGPPVGLEMRHEWLARGNRSLTEMKLKLLGYSSSESAKNDTITSSWIVSS